MQWSPTASSRGLRTALVLAGGVLALAAPLRAFDPDRTIAQHVRRTWTTEEGLPQGSANGLVQTRDGYLWIATFAGLARFDGVRFETYNRARHPELPSDRLLALLEDSDGTLWVGTERHGLATFREGTFRRFELPEAIPSLGVARLVQGPSGDVWAGTSRGLLRIRDGSPIARYTTEDGLPKDLVRAVVEEPDGTVWIGTGGGLVRMDPSGDVSAIPALEGLELGQGVHALLRDRAGVLWIGADRGLFRMSEDRAEQVPLSEDPAHR
ncbi:MAG: two-component regulator propeller domain-containing protein, partial [Acidobacteriota bacterium]